MPEGGPAATAQQLPPPATVRLGADPSLQRIEVPPVLADADVEWEQPEHKQLMEQQPVRPGLDRLLDLGAEPRQRPHAPQGLDLHPQQDHHQVGMPGEIDGLPPYLGHGFLTFSTPGRRPGWWSAGITVGVHLLPPFVRSWVACEVLPTSRGAGRAWPG